MTLLTPVNRSFTHAVWRTLRVPNRVLMLALLLVPTVRRLFGFAPVPLAWLGGCGLAALAG